MIADNPLHLTDFSYIVTECFHIAGFVMAIGTTASVDFRLLGMILPQQEPEQLASAITWWMAGGLIVAVFTGFMLFSADPDAYYLNFTFLIKMAILTLAIATNYTIHRKAVLPGVSSRRRKIVAAVSLGFWISTVCCGIFIANNILDFSHIG